jgi:hypothetical protein
MIPTPSNFSSLVDTLAKQGVEVSILIEALNAYLAENESISDSFSIAEEDHDVWFYRNIIQDFISIIE